MSGESPALAVRLKELRTAGLGGRPVTQALLAAAMGVSVPLVSSWENPNSSAAPTEGRLKTYALLFSTKRSFDGTRLRTVPLDSLTPTEHESYERLEAELLSLYRRSVLRAPNDRSVATEDNPWLFRSNQDITIVCAELPEDMRRNMPYTDPADPDYVAFYRYADLDALVELYGHLRALNPDNLVTIRLATEMVEDDYTSHLVLLGGVDWNIVTRRLLDVVDVPVRQISSYVEGPESGTFEVDGGGDTMRFGPRLSVGSDGAQTLVEDVAHFFRGPNPWNHRRTVSICNGLYGRGTFGAVRALTDVRFRSRNTEYLLKTFGGGDTYSVLSRVQVEFGRVVTPDWGVGGTVLHEWPERPG